MHIRFLPDDSDRAKLTSRSFVSKCALKQRLIFDQSGVPRKIENGELVPYGPDEP